MAYDIPKQLRSLHGMIDSDGAALLSAAANEIEKLRAASEHGDLAHAAISLLRSVLSSVVAHSLHERCPDLEREIRDLVNGPGAGFGYQHDGARTQNIEVKRDDHRRIPDFDAIDRRIAEVESRVRLNTHRIEAAREAMCECVAYNNLHASVRFLADTLALNLAAKPAEAPNHEHTPATPGPRMPAVYGSFKTEVCTCGAWRVNGHYPDPWRTDDINEATRESEDDR